MPFFTVASLWNNEAAIKFMIFISHKIYSPLFFCCTFIRLKVIGKEKINREQPYIIVSNHPSSIDIMANGLAFPGYYKYLAKKTVNKYPIMGFFMKKVAVIVDRADPDSRRKSLGKLKKELEKGYSIFIYPEGTRNRTGQLLGKFYSGAFRLAIETCTPILVATICQVERISKAENGLNLWPGQFEIHWSDPIDVSSYDINNYNDLKQKVRTIMEHQLLKHGR